MKLCPIENIISRLKILCPSVITSCWKRKHGDGPADGSADGSADRPVECAWTGKLANKITLAHSQWLWLHIQVGAIGVFLIRAPFVWAHWPEIKNTTTMQLHLLVGCRPSGLWWSVSHALNL
eukprot:1673284-Rhodomonas_salina.1